MSEKVSTYCFEVYRQSVPPHEGLLRTTCVEASNLEEATNKVQSIVDEKYDFKTYFIKK